MMTSVTTAHGTVLLLGGTGRTGGRVLRQLLDRGVPVRAVVRAAERLPVGVADDPLLTVVEADLLALSDPEVDELVEGCDAVVSCLGHNISAQGVFGQPRDLVTRAVERVYRAIRDLRSAPTAQPAAGPVKLVLMSSVSVNRPRGLDTRRGRLEKAYVAAVRGLVPPARDNQHAADFLLEVVGSDDPRVEWVVVRPDSLRDGDVTAYVLHEGLVDSLFRPGETNMANVAHFMSELVTDADAWAAWHGKLPVVVNAQPAAASAG